jgi:hypothetical protein
MVQVQQIHSLDERENYLLLHMARSENDNNVCS